MDKKIKILKNGPYLIPAEISVIEEDAEVGKSGYPENWQQTNELTNESGVSICRCGQSRNLPFCDGSHVRTGFDGTETAIEEKFKKAVFEGKKLILNDTDDLCSLARFCDRGGRIWNLIQEPDEESNQMAIEEAKNCPSGRLVLVDKQTGQPIEPDFEPSVSVTRDSQIGVGGPLWVKGGLEIESADGKAYEIRNRVCLCRCGQSKNKPFCDATHAYIKFDKK